jgi:hypothetical protein
MMKMMGMTMMMKKMMMMMGGKTRQSSSLTFAQHKVGTSSAAASPAFAPAEAAAGSDGELSILSDEEDTRPRSLPLQHRPQRSQQHHGRAQQLQQPLMEEPLFDDSVAATAGAHSILKSRVRAPRGRDMGSAAADIAWRVRMRRRKCLGSWILPISW